MTHEEMMQSEVDRVLPHVVGAVAARVGLKICGLEGDYIDAMTEVMPEHKETLMALRVAKGRVAELAEIVVDGLPEGVRDGVMAALKECW